MKRFPGRGAAVYFLSYGIWRFFIEFLRADDRGSTVVPFLTPSQLVSLLLIAAGAVILLIRAGKRGKAHG